MRDILSRISKWWEAGESFGLATVTRTYRSAPRDPGAALAVHTGDDHEVVGSVSGGCVEGAVYELALDVCRTGQPVFETYGVSDDDAFAVGLTCGGIIDIFVERIDRESFPELGEIAAAVERGEPVAVATVIDGPGRIGARRIIWADDTAGGTAGGPGGRPASAATAPTVSASVTSSACSSTRSRPPRGCWCSARSTSRPAWPGSGSSSATTSPCATPARYSRPHPGSPTRTRWWWTGRTGSWPGRTSTPGP